MSKSSTLKGWENARAESALPEVPGHTIHSYFNISPESPDGRWVLCFSSAAADAGTGEVCIRSRETGECRVLAEQVVTEDAHRVACQQWCDGGNTVVFHRERDGRWEVVAVDLDGDRERILCTDRLLCWGSAMGQHVPVYGLHWDESASRDLELVDVRTGAMQKVLTAAAVVETFRREVQAWLGTTNVSIFFPILSPDGGKVMFKLASPTGGAPRSDQASRRQGLFVYDLREEAFCFARQAWGHPAWSPDGSSIVNVQNLLIDAGTGAERHLAEIPDFPMSHPSWHPAGTCYVTDTQLGRFGGFTGECGIVLVDPAAPEWRLIQRFDFRGGAASWRIPHPHPVFSADGMRIYFNSNQGPRTRLMVLSRSGIEDREDAFAGT